MTTYSGTLTGSGSGKDAFGDTATASASATASLSFVVSGDELIASGAIAGSATINIHDIVGGIAVKNYSINEQKLDGSITLTPAELSDLGTTSFPISVTLDDSFNTPLLTVDLKGSIETIDGGKDITAALSATAVVPDNSFSFLDGAIRDPISATVVLGGTLSAPTRVISGGQVVTVSSGQTDYGDVVLSGGEEIVASGGRVSGLTLSGGVGTVLSGGGVVGATVSRGAEVIWFGGLVTATTVLSGGSETISVGGVDRGATVSKSGEQSVYGSAVSVVLRGGRQDDHGRTTGTVVSSGGIEVVSSGATATGMVISSGGSALVSSGGTASATVVLSGGSETVSSGGADRGATVSKGGEQGVYGSAVSAVVRGGRQDDRGRTSGTVVSSGGVEVVSSGATASGTVISSGGAAVVSSGGTASAAIILSGGSETVSVGGVDRGATVSKGGEQSVYGSAVSAVVRGGRQDDRGRTTGTIVSSGGVEVISSGATASATVILSGGSVLVSSGGTASGAVISGGKLEIVSGGKAGTVGFSHSGTLQLDASRQFSGTISGFSLPDQIDLRDIAYTSGATRLTWTQHTGSGTLTVTSGSHSATLTLDGTYTSGEFHLGTDNAGGTLVTDPPVTIVPGGGNQTLAALSGPTIFDFSADPVGNDTITGFDAAQDTIQLSAQFASGFAAIEADMSAVGGGTRIMLGTARSITISGVSPDLLTAANFRLV